VFKRIFCAVACLYSLNVSSTYVYEANQALIDLTNQSGTTNLNAGDDQVSSAFSLGFTFDFYGEAFTQGRMATNGCLHFKTSGAYCNDYTPDPLTSQFTYALVPFWTDLIRDSGSSMLAKSFDDKTVFGWYDMKEYGRSNTDNSFEVILWRDDNFEFRYGALDIEKHDVLIGEVGSGSSQVYQYLFHDQCSTGSTNASNCTGTWNSSSSNTLLENTGSLYGLGTGNAIDCSDPLNNAGCSGYATAYQTQQCNITQLYNDSCPLYWEAYDDQQCDLNPQYAPFCRGYSQQDSVAFFDDSTADYGFIDEQDQFATGIFFEEHEDLGFEEIFGTTDMFEDDMFLLFEDFNSNPMDYFAEPTDEMVIFFEPEQLPFGVEFSPTHEPMHHQEDMLLDEFLFQETFLVEDYSEPETFIEFNSVEELEEWFEEETRHEEEFAELDEPEEEIFEEEAVEEVFEAIEERMAEAEIEEERLELEEEQSHEPIDEIREEFELVENESPTGKSKLMKVALNVVKQGLNTAKSSYSSSFGGASNNSVVSGSNNAATSSSSGGISTSSSPSASDQFASASQQTNQVLSMSNTSGGSSNMSVSTAPMPTFTDTASMAIADVQVSNVQGEIDTASSGVMTSSEADQIADKIIAANIEEQQEEIEQEQQDTGQYGDESKLVALIGYVPDFNAYSQTSVPDSKDWYISANIYTSATLDDNTSAFYGLVNDNLKGLSQMISDQPNMWR